MFTAGIIGVTGYSGIELFKYLAEHPKVKITYLGSESKKGEQLTQVYPFLGKNGQDDPSSLTIKGILPDENMTKIPDIIFTALPHGVSMDVVPEWLKLGAKVIDLSADYRLKNAATYQEWYKQKHKNTALLKEAVYGLSEIFTSEIKGAKLVANPGCFPTSVLLALYPLLKQGWIKQTGLIIDSKTGVSGGGKNPSKIFHFPERTENFQAYKVGEHRHTPEMLEKLTLVSEKEVGLIFTPHLVPMSRGIFSTIYAEPSSDITENQLLAFYQDYYRGSDYVIPTHELPETKWVSGTNHCMLSPKRCSNTGRIIVMSIIDNLVKGASGQAVQNMNLMLGVDEKLGLPQYPQWP